MIKNKSFAKDKIGVLLLAYNSISTVEKCILSAKRISRQIVLVDSGSTDGTENLCSRLGAEIYFRKWDNNFAAQRNFALAHIRTEWVLMLDSDEFLSEFTLDKFTEIISNPLIGGINFKIINILDGGKTSSSHHYTRMFRREKGIMFEGRIHEQIRSSIIGNGFVIYDSDFEIIHTGYSQPDSRKFDRNIKMLENEILNFGTNDFLKYHLASTYFAKGDNDKALELFDKLTDSFQLSPMQIDILRIRMAQIYLQKGDYKRVMELTDFISEDIDLEGLKNFILAAVLISDNKFSKAYQLLQNDSTQKSSLIDKLILNESIFKLNRILGVHK